MISFRSLIRFLSINILLLIVTTAVANTPPSIPLNNLPTIILPHESAYFSTSVAVQCSAQSSEGPSSLTLIKEQDASPLPTNGIYKFSYDFPAVFHFEPKLTNNPFALYYFINDSNTHDLIIRCGKI